MIQGQVLLTSSEFAANLSQNQTMVFPEFEGHGSRQLPIGSSTNDIIELMEIRSDFEGQSPPPFTDPPSPVLSEQDVSIAAPPSSNSYLRDALPAPSSSKPPSILSYEVADKPDIAGTSSKTRYLQQEETEHQHRLEALLSQYDPDHPVVLDRRLRPGGILQNKGRLEQREQLSERWQKEARKYLVIATQARLQVHHSDYPKLANSVRNY